MEEISPKKDIGRSKIPSSENQQLSILSQFKDYVTPGDQTQQD